jgi:hypothetical protein
VKRAIAIAAAALVVGAGLGVGGHAGVAHAAAIGASDFIKANGTVLKTGSGTGSTINLRGTNLGGWLTQEDWMSPLGEFALDRTGWVASASAGTAANAIDGSGTTRWTTGANQTGSDWIQLDLGAPTLFNRISFDDRAFAGTYARGYAVQSSTNGTTWVTVAAAAGNDPVTTATFAPQVTRYVRVMDTAAASAQWSVGEINLFSDAVINQQPFTATATASATGTTPAMALDGNVSTVWQTGAAQTSGQSFTLDMHRNIDVGKVLLDSGAASPNDYPRNYTMSGSNDGVNWTTVATGYGTNRITVADLQGAKNMRYLRIDQNGTAGNWWSIGEIAIYSGSMFDRVGWTVTASTGAVGGVLTDGDPATRWSTGAAQAPGQWLQVDFGAKSTFNNVELDTQKNTSAETDYPRGYQVQVSQNGTTWSTVATGVGTFKATNINFPAVGARYMRINQTGTSGSWWSIGELNVGLNSDDYSLQQTMLDRFGATTAQSVIDAHQNTWITSADLDNIQASGMNFVRLPIGWNTFLNLDGTWKANPWTKVDWLVSQAASRGMYTLIDLHTLPGGDCPWGSCGRVGPNPNGFWGSTTSQGWVEDIWKKIATRYKGNPAVAGYDLMNEPLIDYNEDTDDVTQKSAYYNTLYNDVRAIDPDHTIFMEAFFDYTKLASPSTYGWTNVAYELHPYDMPNAKNWTSQDALVTQQLSTAASNLASTGVPILYGEYSLYYYDDVWSRWMAGLNALGVSWSNWSYKVRGTDTDGFGYWGMYYNDPAPVPIINSDDSATFIAKLGQFGTSNFTKNTEFVGVLSKYAGGRSTWAPTQIPRTGWTATASSTEPGGSAANGIDGNGSTRWSSGTPQAGGEWYQVDMGSAQTVAEVTIQTPANGTWDYPRNLNLQVSTNGSTWTTVASGIGFAWKRPIMFTPVTARYVRVTQTGAAPQWWSIDELTAMSSY